jgi:hypothetical protein
MHNNTYEEDALSTREILLYSFGSILLLGGTYFLGKKIIRNVAKKQEENVSYDDESIAGYAKGMKMAFDNDGWWGTDISALRSVMQSIPNKEVFQKVIKSYQRLYNKNLMADLQSEVNITVYNEMLAIIKGKGQVENGQVYLSNKTYEAWARRLKAAFDKTHGFIPATDEDAIRAVFIEIPTKKAFNQVAIAYKILYTQNLMSDLKSELEFWEFDPMMKLINDKPN